MSNLLKLELRNLFRLKSLYICTLLIFLISTILPFVGTISGYKKTAFSVVIDFLTSEMGFVSIIFVTIFVCLDFSENTNKNIISRGFTRKQLLLSKYIVSVIAVFLMDITISLLTIILFIKDGVGFDSNMIYPLIGFVFTVFAQTAIIVTLSFIIQKLGGAIIANIFITMFMPLVLLLVDTKLKLKLSSYWVDNIGTILSKKGADIISICHSGAIAVSYIIVFLVLGILISKNKEVK